MTNAKRLALAAAIAAAVYGGYRVVKVLAAVSSCDPYIMYVWPDGTLHYYRMDGSERPKTHWPDGHDVGSGGGSDHTQLWALDGMEIPTASGALCPDGYPCATYPAPYRDVLIEHQPPPPAPPKWLCDVYRQENGPHAKPCPSGLTQAQYSAEIKKMPQWKTDPLCKHYPTPTPTGGTPVPTGTPTAAPSHTQTATPTAATPTRTPTSTVTAKPTVAVVCFTVTATRTPCIGPQSGCPTKSPTPTPNIGPQKSKTPTGG